MRADQAFNMGIRSEDVVVVAATNRFGGNFIAAIPQIPTDDDPRDFDVLTSARDIWEPAFFRNRLASLERERDSRLGLN